MPTPLSIGKINKKVEYIKNFLLNFKEIYYLCNKYARKVLFIATFIAK